MQKKPLKECRILITPTSYGKYDKNLKLKLEEMVKEVVYNTEGKPLSADELTPIIENFDGMIAGLDEINKEVISRAKNLKVISRYGSGYDRVDIEAAKEAGIYVTNTPGANSTSVAELTIGLAIAAARSIPYANIETKKGQWPRLKGITLEGKVFGLVGLGSIAKEVVLRLKGFNCKLVTHHPHRNIEFEKEYDIEYCSLDDLLGKSDFVSLHLPVTPATSRMVNKDFLNKMILQKWQILAKSAVSDNKSKLQELTQRESHQSPVYQLLKSWGPDHARRFEIGVYLGEKLLGKGLGKNKQEAAQNAAKDALSRLKG